MVAAIWKTMYWQNLQIWDTILKTPILSEPRKIIRNLQCVPKLGSLRLIEESHIRKTDCHHSRKCLTILIFYVIWKVKSVLFCYFWFSFHSIKISLKLLILLLLFYLFFSPPYFQEVFYFSSLSAIVSSLLKSLLSFKFQQTKAKFQLPGNISGWIASSAYQWPGRRHVHTQDKAFWLYKACCRTVNINEEKTMPRRHWTGYKLREEQEIEQEQKW